MILTKRLKRINPITKAMNVKLVFLGVIITLIGIVSFYSIYGYLTSPKYEVIKLSEFSKIYSLQIISKNELLIGGVVLLNNNTLPQGIAGIYFINNNTFIPFNVTKYFQGGYVYSLGYNGTFVLIGGSSRINDTLHTSLVGVNLENQKVYNLSKYISPFYQIGQIFSIDWTGSYWLVGGNAYITGVLQSPFLIPFLLKVNSSGFHDLSPYLPSDFKVIGGSSTIYYIFSNNNSSIIIGGNAVNMTVTILDGSKFENVSFNFLHIGVLLTANYWNGYWVVGGENLTNPDNPVPFIGIINGTRISPVNIMYKLGVVTSMTTINDNLVISIRVPFVSNNGTSYGSVVLYGNNINDLKTVYSKPFVVLEQLSNYNNLVVGAGYSQFGNYFNGTIIIWKSF